MEQEKCLLCSCRCGQGLRIFSYFLCGACEQKLIHTSPTDERYAEYVLKLKKIWPEVAAETRSMEKPV